jgi:hypothetical protein
LPPLDYARSYRAQMTALRDHLPRGVCVVASKLSRAEIAALEVIGGWQVQSDQASRRCDWLVLSSKHPDDVVAPEGWRPVGRKSRPSDKEDSLVVFRRR